MTAATIVVTAVISSLSPACIAEMLELNFGDLATTVNVRKHEASNDTPGKHSLAAERSRHD